MVVFAFASGSGRGRNTYFMCLFTCFLYDIHYMGLIKRWRDRPGGYICQYIRLECDYSSIHAQRVITIVSREHPRPSHNPVGAPRARGHHSIRAQIIIPFNPFHLFMNVLARLVFSLGLSHLCGTMTHRFETIKPERVDIEGPA